MDPEIIFNEFKNNFPNLSKDVVVCSPYDDHSVYIRLKDGRKFKFEVSDDSGFSLKLARRLA